jgi:hypothetical protein
MILMQIDLMIENYLDLADKPVHLAGKAISKLVAGVDHFASNSKHIHPKLKQNILTGPLSDKLVNSWKLADKLKQHTATSDKLKDVNTRLANNIVDSATTVASKLSNVAKSVGAHKLSKSLYSLARPMSLRHGHPVIGGVYRLHGYRRELGGGSGEENLRKFGEARPIGKEYQPLALPLTLAVGGTSAYLAYKKQQELREKYGLAQQVLTKG